MCPMLVAASLVATGCSVLNKGTKAPASKPTTTTATVTDNNKHHATSHATDALLGDWSIIEIDGASVVINGEDHPKITLAQAPGRDDILRVIGFDGCNYINGDWQIRGNKIIPAGEFLSSMRSCPDAPYEQAVNAAIHNVASYQMTGPDNMNLLSSTGRVVMKLRSRNLSFLNGAWRVETINGHAVPASADVKVVIDIDECKIHGDAGCNVLNGAIVVNLDKADGIEFRNLITTRMTCPDIQTEQEFLLALEEVDTATRGASASEAVFKDNSGKTVVTLSRLAPDQITDSDEQ